MTPFELTDAALQEPWRLWTGHFTHWSFEHAAVNLGACMLPLVLLTQQDRRKLLCDLPWLLPLSSLLLLPFLAGRPYRGASELACLLWVAAAFPLACAGRRLEAGVLGVGALLKAAAELAMGIHPLASGPGWEGLPMAHAAGAALGLAWGLQWWVRSSPCPPSSSPEKPSPIA